MAASPAPTMLPDAVTVWREAIEALASDRSPCRHMTPARWAEVRAACLAFLDRFGPEAVQLGWTAPELFGVHPEHGTQRIDCCGALMVNGRLATGSRPTACCSATCRPTGTGRGRPGGCRCGCSRLGVAGDRALGVPGRHRLHDWVHADRDGAGDLRVRGTAAVGRISDNIGCLASPAL